MKIIELIRLVIKHKVLLILVPLLLGGLVFKLTKEPKLQYASTTVLYTGLASGSSIEMDKSFNYFATNTAFDNLINIFKSRETQEEVAIRLLSQHLLLKKPDAKYISKKSFDKLQKEIPPYIYAYVMGSLAAKPVVDSTATTDDKEESSIDLVADSSKGHLFPASIDPMRYELTVAKLTALMKSSDTNYVYKLLNFDDPHYSIKAISTMKVERLSTSDLIKLSYEVDDPGICQQTLAIFSDVCIKNYKHIKENRSDAVVKYFEQQLEKANKQLQVAEEKLLGFNKANNIINYYEQSKAVAVVKEDMEVDYNNKRAQLAGTEAATRRLEDKLNIQQLVQLKSNSVLEKRKQLGDISFEIASVEAESGEKDNSGKLDKLKKEATQLQNEIRKSVDELYTYQNTTDGLPVQTVLKEWINNVIESENLRAKLKVMDQRNKDFQQQYAIYAPAGAQIKKIEREISVSEQGYLEILHGLNLAKLKLQDNELTSNLKTVDPPFYPLESLPTKRGVLIIAAAFIGGLLVLGVVIFMEYFDNTLKNARHASQVLSLPSVGMIPKILKNPGTVNLPFVQNRLLDISTQNIEQFLAAHDAGSTVKTIVFFSTTPMEGKTVLAGNFARRLLQEGKKVLVLNYAAEKQQPRKQRRFPILNRLLGYPDPRVDLDNAFLKDPATYLDNAHYATYAINESFFKAADYTEILQANKVAINEVPDVVLLELPPLIYHNYPATLVAQADMSVLVCRSNRLWTEADQAALDGYKQLCTTPLNFIINGVELKEVEAVLGELPKKSSWLRKKLKEVFRFQFFIKNQI